MLPVSDSTRSHDVDDDVASLAPQPPKEYVFTKQDDISVQIDGVGFMMACAISLRSAPGALPELCSMPHGLTMVEGFGLVCFYDATGNRRSNTDPLPSGDPCGFVSVKGSDVYPCFEVDKNNGRLIPFIPVIPDTRLMSKTRSGIVYDQFVSEYRDSEDRAMPKENNSGNGDSDNEEEQEYVPPIDLPKPTRKPHKTRARSTKQAVPPSIQLSTNDHIKCYTKPLLTAIHARMKRKMFAGGRFRVSGFPYPPGFIIGNSMFVSETTTIPLGKSIQHPHLLSTFFGGDDNWWVIQESHISHNGVCRFSDECLHRRFFFVTRLILKYSKKKQWINATVHVMKTNFVSRLVPMWNTAKEKEKPQWNVIWQKEPQDE